MRLGSLKWRPRRDGLRVAYWVCGQAAARAGYPLKTQRVWSGRDPSPDDLRTIRDRCDRLSVELDEWSVSRTRKRTGHSRPGVVYFARSGSYVKIGFSTDLPKRLAKLQVATPHPITLLAAIPGSIVDERRAHLEFEKFRLDRLGEWFRLTPEVAAYIVECAAEQSLNVRSRRS